VAAAVDRPPRRTPRPRRATIVDVAARAGVSKGLVSFVLNDRPGVAPATRRRILDAVDELGWRPNQKARALVNARAYAIGFVLARPAELLAADPFFPAFIAGVEAELSARQASLVLQVVPDLDAELVAYHQLSDDGRVDGVIVADLRVDDPRPRILHELGLPAITLGRPEGRRHCPAVVLEDVAGVVASVEHLIALGHERIAFVGGPETFLHSRNRRRAWRSALQRLSLRDDLYTPGDFGGTSGARATARLMRRRTTERPTAILYANDLMAVAGTAAIARSGRRVPDDVSIVGYDDIAVAAHMHPALTTVRQDATAWGRAAARAVFELVEDGSTDDVELEPARLVIRESTAAPAGATKPPRG
jgi:DNA-binding LacI/PurR family transcriptional regulator